MQNITQIRPVRVKADSCWKNAYSANESCKHIALVIFGANTWLFRKCKTCSQERLGPSKATHQKRIPSSLKRQVFLEKTLGASDHDIYLPRNLNGVMLILFDCELYISSENAKIYHCPKAETRRRLLPSFSRGGRSQECKKSGGHLRNMLHVIL